MLIPPSRLISLSSQYLPSSLRIKNQENTKYKYLYSLPHTYNLSSTPLHSIIVISSQAIKTNGLFNNYAIVHEKSRLWAEPHSPNTQPLQFSLRPRFRNVWTCMSSHYLLLHILFLFLPVCIILTIVEVDSFWSTSSSTFPFLHSDFTIIVFNQQWKVLSNSNAMWKQ